MFAFLSVHEPRLQPTVTIAARRRLLADVTLARARSPGVDVCLLNNVVGQQVVVMALPSRLF